MVGQSSCRMPVGDGLDLRYEFELVQRMLHLVMQQKASHCNIEDATKDSKSVSHSLARLILGKSSWLTPYLSSQESLKMVPCRT